MSDLVSRLLAAIEQTEEDARDASTRSAEWSVADHVAPPWGQEPPDDAILAAGKPIARMNTEYGGCLAASHVARNDPAAVLRRTAADRRTLERHSRDKGPMAFCAHEMVPWPCEDFRDLAARYGLSVEEETTGE